MAFNWIKTNKNGAKKAVEEDPFFTGLGYWTRANPELCLLGTRGKPKRFARDVRRLIVSERREHSRKPDEASERIQRLVGGPYLEMFARERRRGWDALGDQLDVPETVYKRRQPSRINAPEVVSPVVSKAYAAK